MVFARKHWTNGSWRDYIPGSDKIPDYHHIEQLVIGTRNAIELLAWLTCHKHIEAIWGTAERAYGRIR